MLKELIKLANELDGRKLFKEANYLDNLLFKEAGAWDDLKSGFRSRSKSGVQIADPDAAEWVGKVRQLVDDFITIIKKAKKEFKVDNLEALTPEQQAQIGTWPEVIQLQQGLMNLFAEHGLYAMAKLTHDESVALIMEIRQKSPEMEFSMNVNGRVYSTH